MSQEPKPVESPSAAPVPPSKSSLGMYLKRGLLVVVVILAGLAGIVAIQPNEFRITRSATMAASPDVVFAQVNDFHNWEGWSPWAKLDPAAKNFFEGPAAGEGAIFSWDGNDKVGAGRMTILESRPPELVRINLEFTRPMQDTSTTEFTFKPDADKTAVTWTMSGRHTFMSKAFCMMMDMDQMVGSDFEKGLANMQKVVEGTK